MGKSIFVSYKYSDTLVRYTPNIENQTTARHYVDLIEEKLGYGDHIYKGEDDGEDLSSLADTTIASKLGDKIFHSSVTIVLISKGMKNTYVVEKEQWIPWEISYSLKEQTRTGGRSKTNAILGVILPDENNSYDYFVTNNPLCGSITYHYDKIFKIIEDNMFNHIQKENNIRNCNGTKIYEGNPSFIHTVKWDDFINRINTNVEIAVERRKNINEYTVIKNL